MVSAARRSGHVRLGTALLACAAVVVALGGCSGGSSTPAPSAPMAPAFSHSLPATVMDATLVAADGRRVSLSSFNGKVVVVSDFMSLCQESCPLDTANMLAAARAVEKAGLGDKVEFLSISIDPTRDTVARLTAFRKLYEPAPKDWMVLTSTQSVLGPFWKDLGVYIKKTEDKPPLPHDWWTGKPLHYDITHSDDVFFLDPTGRWRYLLDGVPHVAQGAPIPERIRTFMDAEGKRNIADPGPAAWTVPQALYVLSWLTKHKLPRAGLGAT